MNVKDQTTIRDLYEAGEFEIHTWDLDGTDFPTLDGLGHLAPGGPDTPPWHANWEEDPINDDFLRVTEIVRNATGMPFEERVRP